MSNMSYCRFENTFNDLIDCLQNIAEETNSRDEQYRQNMLALLVEMVEQCDSQEDLLDYLENEF